MRKIVQIAVAYAPNDEDHDGAVAQDRLFALCDDGTVWIHRWPTSGPEEWTPLVNVPQDKVELMLGG